MDDQRFGAVLRSVRRRHGLTQAEVGRRSGLSQASIARIELGHSGTATLDTLRAVGRALGVRVEMDARWRGPDLARLLDERHARMQACVSGILRRAGWEAVPEATFSVYGERGSIDILGWHPVRRAALVVEVKTSIADVQDLLSTLDRKRRLARRVCAERGWEAGAVGVWLVVRESGAERRRVGPPGGLVRSVLPHRAVAARRWLVDPVGPLAAVSFLPDIHPGDARRRPGAGRGADPGARRRS